MMTQCQSLSKYQVGFLVLCLLKRSFYGDYRIFILGKLVFDWILTRPKLVFKNNAGFFFSRDNATAEPSAWKATKKPCNEKKSKRTSAQG